MSTATTYAALRSLGAPFVTTGEAAAALRTSTSAASRSLATLARQGLVRRVRRGLWDVAAERVDPRRAIGELTRPYPAYVSFTSALASRGAIDQIPREIAVASLARPHRVRTALGTYAIHRLPPELFGGFEEVAGVRLATVEKAIFDHSYVTTVSGSAGRRLPELDLPAGFSRRRIDGWVARIRSPRLKTLVTAAVDRVLEHAEHEDRPRHASRARPATRLTGR